MRVTSGLVVLALVAGSTITGAQQPGSNRITVPLSDPSRPGTVKIRMLNGRITIKGANVKDIVIEAPMSVDAAPPRQRSARADGLRRLTQPAGVDVKEEGNVVSITRMLLTDESEMNIQVPTRTNLQLSAVAGGDMVIEGVEGDIEATNVAGGITLTNVAGSIVAHSVNGGVTATVRQVTPDKPMAFTSLNGDVDVTLPASSKANLKLRSDQGDVYTDFEVQPTAPPPGATRATPRGPRDGNRDRDRGKYRLLMDRAIYGTVNGGGPEFELRTFNGEVFLRKAK